jgi:hypothetical protein
VIAVAHAVRAIEQDDDLPRPLRRRGHGVAPQERARERQHDERERRQPHRKEKPVPDASAPHGLIWNPPQEHQRRELHHVAPLALYQVQQHRNRNRGQARQEERSEE